MKQNNEVCIKKKYVVPALLKYGVIGLRDVDEAKRAISLIDEADVGSVVRCNVCMYSRSADPDGLYCAHEEIGKYRPVKNDFFCAYGQSGLSAEKGPEIPKEEE